MKIKIKILITIFKICLLAQTSQGQVDYRFDNKSSYFKFINKEYSLDSTSIYYVSDATKKTVFLIPAFTFFIKGDKILTINEVANSLNSNCPPRKLFTQLSYDLVENLLDQKGYNVDLTLKNLNSNDILNQNDTITALFLFSVDWKKLGIRYIKHKKKLEDLGFKTIVLSNDMPLINGVVDYSKFNQLQVKKN
ncbi:hypothetical protein [Winogradskyella sp.]|uniref:hypothetical protein n=1 Tax=Winogradskyella sp. TaxID=1883156 RepID=UPI002634F7C8|nr:hypothetical protein [Winogradskyella sp.]